MKDKPSLETIVKEYAKLGLAHRHNRCSKCGRRLKLTPGAILESVVAGKSTRNQERLKRLETEAKAKAEAEANAKAEAEAKAKIEAIQKAESEAKAAAEQLADNYAAAFDEVLRAKPASSKGRYIRKAVVSTTMGPGVALDTNYAREGGPIVQ